jgi:ATP-binding cassette subfamily B protein/subfamily B ATP-binding cassette protein MsbA
MGRLCCWALTRASRRWPALAAVLGAMLLQVGLDVLKPWPMKVLIDHVVGERVPPPELAAVLGWLPGGSTPEGLLTWCVAATVLIFLLTWALGLAGSLANIAFGQRLVYDLAGELFARLQRLPLRFHSRSPIGDMVRRVTGDCGCVAVIIKDALLPLLVAMLSLAVMFVVMWQLDSTLTLLALAVIPCMILVFRRYARPMAEMSYTQQEAEGGLYAVIEQTLSAVPIVQAFAREDDGDRRFSEGSCKTVGAALAATGVQLRFKILMGLTTTLGTALTLWVGASHVLNDELSVGSVLVFLSYLGSLYAPLESVMYTPATLQGAAGSARRVLELLETEPEIKDAHGAWALANVRGHVRFEGVTFGYEPGRPVLRGLSMEVQPGETIAIVGVTGAGKTTLVNLIARFFDPWEGRITLDGHDLRAIQVRSLREHVAFVLQEPLLFPFSIAENIAYGRPGASAAETEIAARAANAHTFIERLPQGYDTVVGERGATLSGGERQRISIARAILKDAPILILDEPASALDAETEGLVLDALERLKRGRTTFLIAHRLSTIRDADRVVVLQDSRIAEIGTHDELLTQAGLYAHFHQLQHEGVGSGGGV